MKYKKFGLVICGLLCLVSLTAIGYNYNRQKAVLKDISSKTFELGEGYLEEIKELSDSDDVRVIRNIDSSKKELELIKDGKSRFIEVEVRDTKKPVFVKQSDCVELGVGSSENDLLALFEAKDDSEILEYYVEGYIDYNISGEYKVRVACSDSFANTSVVDVLVKIQ